MKTYNRLVSRISGSILISCFVVQIHAVPFYLYHPLQNAGISSNQAMNSSISGFVFDQQRMPVREVPVELMNEVNSVIQRTKTDGGGRYMFRGVPSGRLYVKVLPLGTSLEEQTQEVEIVTLGPLGRQIADNIQKDFYLRQRKDSSNITKTNSVLFVQEVPEEAKKLYEQGISNLEEKRSQDGIAGLENSIKIFPTYFAALERLGLEYIQQQRYEDAKRVLSEAITVNPRSFNSLYGLSYANYSLKQFEPAIQSAQKALEVERNSANTLLLLGISLRSTKQYNKAEEMLVKAKKIDRENPEIHWNLALLYAHNLKRYSDAANELEFYLKTTPDNPKSEDIKKLIKQFRDKSTQPD